MPGLQTLCWRRQSGANPSLKSRIPCFSGKIQGISSFTAPRAQISGRKANPNQLLTHKFPTNRNRELIWTYQGIKSRHQGKSPLHQGKGASPPDLRFAPLMDMDFATRCPLVRRLRERQSELFSRGQKGNSTVEHRLKRAGRAAGVCQSWFSPPPSVTSAVGKRPARVDFDNIPEVLSWSDAVSIEGS